MNLPIVLNDGSIYHIMLKSYDCSIMFLFGYLLNIYTKNGASYCFSNAKTDFIAGLYS